MQHGNTNAVFYSNKVSIGLISTLTLLLKKRKDLYFCMYVCNK